MSEALALLHEKGMLTRERNRGFFTARTLAEPLHEVVRDLGLEESDVVTSVYFRIADDLLRRLLSYRSMQSRERYVEHCKQHLHVLDLLERERNVEASEFLRQHLQHTIASLSKIEDILLPPS